MPQTEAHLTVVIYDRKTFIVQANGVAMKRNSKLERRT